MLKNYIKIALRNMLRSKVYSLINISGLSMGIACCLLLAMYVQDEFSYDRHHKRLGDLYRIDGKTVGSDMFDVMSTTSPPIAMTMREEIPEVESAVRVLSPVSQCLIKYQDQIFYETDGYIADSTLFDVLTYDLTEGNPKKALTDANTVVLSETLAKKIFGSQPALDNNITISMGQKSTLYKITGVFKDDKKSFLHANFFVSMMSEGWGEYIRNDPDASKEWAGQNFIPSYVKLVPGHSKAEVEKKMNVVLEKHGAASMKALGIYKTILLEPVKDIYLRSIADKSPRITYIYVIVSIALFILLIACINFMNLSTAKATKRATEIGVRKVMGAFRSSLVTQIFGEAVLIVLFSVLISLVMVELALPWFNELSGKSISFDRQNIVYFGLALLALTLLTGLIAGSYPAFFISSFQPVQVLKGKFNLGSTGARLRQSLVIFQFMIAIVLVCGMIVIFQQLSFIQQKNLGFDAHAKIVLPLRTTDARNHYDGLKSEILRNNLALKVSGAQFVPGNRIFNDMLYYTNGSDMEHAIDNYRNAVDADFIELLGIKMIAGRTFTDNRKLESNGKVIINLASAKKFGMEPNKIVGQTISFEWHGKKSQFEVIGVMDDFNQSSLKDKISPTLFDFPDSSKDYRNLIASVDPSRFKESIASIEKVWKSQVSDTPFEYSFLDENIQKQYNEDQKMSSIITGFTAIAIIICSLGLYGLSSYMAERRFKEIGVRKVMGASVNQIVRMMSKEFIRLVVVAFILAVPIAWYAMNLWLGGFEYRIPVSISIFIYAGLAALTIAVITVSYESIRAASTNPVNSLRNE